MSTQIRLSPEAEQFCRQHMGELIERVNGAYGVILSTVDGHALLDVVRGEIPASRIAAMTSSLISLGETIAKEANQRECRFVIVENSDGYVVTLRIAAKLVLTSFANKQANLGMLLSGSRSAAEGLAKRIKT